MIQSEKSIDLSIMVEIILRLMKKILSILGILVPLTISVLFDHGYNDLAAKSAQSFSFAPLVWYEAIGSIILAATLFGLAWFVLYFNSSRSIFVAAVYVIVGIFLLFSMSSVGIRFFWSLFLYRTPVIRSWVHNTIGSPLSLTSHYAASIIIIGTAHLIPHRYLWFKADE